MSETSRRLFSNKMSRRRQTRSSVHQTRVKYDAPNENSDYQYPEYASSYPVGNSHDYHERLDGAQSVYSSYGFECCPLVIDTLTLLSLLCGIAGATFFLNNLITMTLVRRKRRRKRREGTSWDSDFGRKVVDTIHSGRFVLR